MLIRAREQTLGKLRVWTLQERRSAERRKFQEQNHLRNTQRKFRMNGNVPTSNEAPSIEVVRDFWTKIVGTVGKVNKDDPGVKEWLKETKKRVGRTSSEGPDSIDETKLRKALKKAKSCSAPGPDSIHTFWWKALPSAQSALADVLRRVVSGDLSVPDWLTRGRTLLIPKKVTRKVRPTTDLLRVSTQCTRLLQHSLHQNYSLTPTLMIFYLWLNEP